MDRIKALFETYKFDYLDDEGVYIKNIYTSPTASHAMGIYCNEPKSFSRFHKLEHDELWHFYEGDPLILHILYDDRTSKSVILGDGEGMQRTFLIKKGAWQAGELLEGGIYALFGCTVSPAFNKSIFSLRNQDELLKSFPKMVEVIQRF